MGEAEADPFGSWFTDNCHINPSQAALLQSHPFYVPPELRHSIPVETTAIRMESPPPEEDTTRVSIEPPQPKRRKSIREAFYAINSKPADQLFDTIPVTKQAHKTALRKCTSTTMVENSDFGLRKTQSLEKGTIQNSAADQVLETMPVTKQAQKTGLIKCTTTMGENCDFQLGKRQAFENGRNGISGIELKKGGIENICGIEFIDLDDDEECDDLARRIKKGKMVCDEFNSVQVVDGAVENGNRKGVELCKDGNGGSVNKGISDLTNGNNKGGEPCKDGNGISDLLKGNDVQHTRVLPPWMLSKDGVHSRETSPNKESKRELLEKNRPVIVDKSKSGDEVNRSSRGSCDSPSSVSGELKSDQIMKNLLDALDLISSGEKEKVDNDESGDFWEFAMKRGLSCPQPKWWPPEKKL